MITLATLSNAGQLDVSGTTLKVEDDLDLSGGTFTSNGTSVLDLKAAATLSSNGLVSFKKANLNGKVLTLGSAGTHLKLTDSNETLSLNNLALETGAGSLTLSGPLSLSGSSQLNSTAGSLTLSGPLSLSGSGSAQLHRRYNHACLRRKCNFRNDSFTSGQHTGPAERALAQWLNTQGRQHNLHHKQ